MQNQKEILNLFEREDYSMSIGSEMTGVKAARQCLNINTLLEMKLNSADREGI